MADKPVDLDEYRGMAAQKETEIRRLLHEVQTDQAALRFRQEELELFMTAADSANWPEVGAKVRYLLLLYAATPQAQDPRHQKLIARVLADIARLSE